MNSRVLVIGGCGYIGCRLAPYLRASGFDVSTVDLEWFGNVNAPENNCVDYRNLSTDFVTSFRHVVLLAGHSSVAMCRNNATSSFANNVHNFMTLVSKLTPEQRLVYASSSSVYGRTQEQLASEDDGIFTPDNHYDLSKFEIDCYARLSALDYYGLRLGTVCGFSQNLRCDLILNRMVLLARTVGYVPIFNAGVHRPVLGIDDLCRAIATVLRGPKRPGLYNLASFNSTVGELGQLVSNHLGVQPRLLADSPTYDFAINSSRFSESYSFTFQDTVESILNTLISECPLNVAERGPRAYD